MDFIGKYLDFLNEVITLISPRYARLRLEGLLALNSTSAEDKQTIRSRLMELSVSLGQLGDALFHYEDIKRHQLFVTWTSVGGEAYVLTRCAHYERSILRQAMLARQTAQRAYFIAMQYQMHHLIDALLLDFPGFLPLHGNEATQTAS
jgi:hypothetical protein